jgi:hypothetical protein
VTAPARLATALEGRYAIQRELGAGGMATVYLATDLKHEREVALKVLRPELGAVLGADRFLAEIKITARLDHPHILTLIDSGAAEGFLYYVLPYVRGESLRVRIDREKQLGIDEALRITMQIASALDYAHQHGVVHRDIKPENILLHEGEAVLADFGIALAVKEAGGNRLTETGLSLGTPQYMSPEQATGDRTLDARSDVYSLAAVLYEMLAGEPPVTGPTAQAMIAKLITERPTMLRVVRDTVPEHVNAAVAKALAKIPADRFASAGDFARSIEAGLAERPAQKPGKFVLAVGGLAFAVVAAGIFLAGKVMGGGSRGPAVVLRDRTQLTFTARIRSPAISLDGRQLAYVTQDCGASACSYAIEIQDVGGTETRRVLSGATSIYGLAWSEDRRHLMVIGTIGGRYGFYVVSAIGGTPRLVAVGAASFFAGGDSILITPEAFSDSVTYLRVSGLNGVVRDSIPVVGRAAFGYALAIPGTPWIAAVLNHGSRVAVRIMDRAGRVSDEQTYQGGGVIPTFSRDALWMQVPVPGQGTAPIERVAFDPVRGQLADQRDTVHSGASGGFTVTADGSALVILESTSQYDVWLLDALDAFRGTFPENRRVARASTFVQGALSRDGRWLLLARQLGSTIQLSLTPAGGGQETVLPTTQPTGWFWVDSATIALRERVNGANQVSLINLRGQRRDVFVLPETALVDYVPLRSGGWAWLSADGLTLYAQPAGAPRPSAYRIPEWHVGAFDISAMPDGRTLAFIGWNRGTFDSLRASVVSLADSAITPWHVAFAESGYIRPLPDGSLLYAIQESQEIWTLFRLRGPGRVERIGMVPRPAQQVGITDDLRRVVVTTRESFGDAFMSRVVRQP